MHVPKNTNLIIPSWKVYDKAHMVYVLTCFSLQIVIEGAIGLTVEGDIAIDDVSLTPGCEYSDTPLPTASTQQPRKYMDVFWLTFYG